MNKYKVYKHSVLGYEIIKEGFSWPGFFFTWIWAFLKKLNTQGAILLPVVFISNSLGLALTGPVVFISNSLGLALTLTRPDVWANIILSLVLVFGPGVFVGKKGNSWREKSMTQRGFELKEEIEAESVDSVLAKIEKSKNENT
jgi:hypothetical protein